MQAPACSALPLNDYGTLAMKLIFSLLASALLSVGMTAQAQDAALRKTLTERIPQLDKIEEVRPTPMAGLYEVRIGTDRSIPMPRATT